MVFRGDAHEGIPSKKFLTAFILNSVEVLEINLTLHFLTSNGGGWSSEYCRLIIVLTIQYLRRLSIFRLLSSQ